MRAAHMLDRSLVRFRIIERDPAGQHLAGDEPIVVGVVLMEAERLAAGLLPDDVVLTYSCSRPATQFGASLPDIGTQDDRSDGEIGLPAIADLTREVLRIASEPP